MKQMKTEDALGQVLCHDVTRIVKGVTKDAAFRKGHVITQEDIPLLLNLGKEHVYIWENDGRTLHENEAAEILRDLCQGPHMTATQPKEGKIELYAEADGLLLVDTRRLKAVNSLGEMVVATRPSGFVARRGDKLCGTRVIPLVIEREKLNRAREAAGEEPLLRLLPIRPRDYGLVVTGSEVYKGRIQDTFTPVIRDKLAEYGCQMAWHEVVDDDPQAITAAVNAMLGRGAGLVLCTGGMSVDADDRTPLAIKNTGAQLVSYGAPVLPGAMFLLAYTQDGRPICGLPGCVMYARRTIFDLVLPHLLAGNRVTAGQLAGLGHGGLCLDCPDCRFPNCMFGKGV